MHANPKKCCGKDVKFTPKNVTTNWIFSHLEFVNPVNEGYHRINPATTESTASMDNT